MWCVCSLGRLAKSIVGGLQLLAVEAETRFTIEEGFPDSVIFLRVFQLHITKSGEVLY